MKKRHSSSSAIVFPNLVNALGGLATSLFLARHVKEAAWEKALQLVMASIYEFLHLYP